MATPIRFSAPDWCFYRDAYGAEAYYARLREIGIEAVEMVDPSRYDAVGMPMIDTAGPGELNRADLFESNVVRLLAGIHDVRAAGIQQLIVFSGNENGIDQESGIAACVRALKAVANEAEAQGIILTLEMFNIYDHPGYHAVSSEYGFAVSREVDSPAVKVLYDAYHMHRMGESVLADLRNHIELISHIHLADVDHRSAPKPHGTPPTLQVIETALAAGYTGYFGLEYIPKGDPLDELAMTISALR